MDLCIKLSSSIAVKIAHFKHFCIQNFVANFVKI